MLCVECGVGDLEWIIEDHIVGIEVVEKRDIDCEDEMEPRVDFER